jgi:predicted transglutaminase-like cysteine proteinase
MKMAGLVTAMVLIPGIASAAVSGPQNAAPRDFGRDGVLRARQTQPRVAVEGMDWTDALASKMDPAQICRAVRARVAYTPDTGPADEWSAADRTWDRRKGDCEDFAVCVLALCKANGIQASIRIFVRRGTGDAHAVVVGEWNGSAWMSSNGSFEDLASRHDAAGKVARDLGWWAPDVAEAQQASAPATTAPGVFAMPF